ncbi:MAG: hypothetical protein DMD58_07345 [Gemmatimonadetes bacterium]|nr:MAG: hypothetical protein DMD58_07345 [Gemmatimonadota bacterium]
MLLPLKSAPPLSLRTLFAGGCMIARSIISRLAVCLALLPAAAAAQADKIPWARGPAKGALGSEATINVPAGCLFTGRDGVKTFLAVTENPVSGNERGVIMCQSEASPDPWFVLFSYDQSGYVRDDEGSNLDADAILESVRRGTEEANRERKRHGWSTLSVDGWATKPFYDRATNNLTWAITAHDNTGGRTVNHSVRLLGRGGVMHADLVTTPEQLNSLVPTFNGMIGGYTYSPGFKYAEWRSGDKVAAYGLTALVAGGAGVALAKSGLLVKFWKLIVVGVGAGLAALKRMWARITGKGNEMHAE